MPHDATGAELFRSDLPPTLPTSLPQPLTLAYLRITAPILRYNGISALKRSLYPPTDTKTIHQADKLRTQQQLESLQNKYIGTGHADTTKHEWTSNIARDSYASYQGHPPLLQYMSIGMGQSMERTRMMCMEKMVLPVGPAPPVED